MALKNKADAHDFEHGDDNVAAVAELALIALENANDKLQHMADNRNHSQHLEARPSAHSPTHLTHT